MAENTKLPMGIENFKEIRTMGYYYVDKTGLIKDLLENPGKVNLFTRPRRFGKTLNMSMLKYFFETGNNCSLFDGLEISKESIFTGLNNFNVYTITDVQYNAYFGFTDTEVKKMLEFYGFMQQYNTIKEWYNGYQFGNLEIYCPWDVISYCHRLKMNPSASPQNYWINTSNNNIVKKFINKATPATRKEIEELIAGGSIKKIIRQELTYKDIDSKIDNLWSLLLATGYLTQLKYTADSDMAELIIPNKEIRMIFIRQIKGFSISYFVLIKSALATSIP